MAHYVVGDIQGCYDPLAGLLDQVKFDPVKDTLFCVGDLINRGAKSLKTLRFLHSMGDSCQTVLGNHDLHLLSVFYGVRTLRSTDTLTKILDSSDAPKLVNWLRTKPLLIVNKKRQFVLSHAGIYPWWTLQQAEKHAQDVEKILRDDTKCVKFLSRLYGNKPSKWHPDLGRIQRRRFTVNAFTRMRFCSPRGHLNLTESGYSGKSRKNRVPWFQIENPSLHNYKVVFGHWSALGLLNTRNHLALDTGCVWGRELTMAKLPKNPDKPVALFTKKAK